LAILSSAYRERRALALGVHDSAGNLGEVLAPLTIGTLLTYVDWRGALQIWAIPGLSVGLIYALFSAEEPVVRSKPTTFKRSLWQGVFRNGAVFGMFLVSVFRTMGQTALLTFLPLYLTLERNLSVTAMGAYLSVLFLFAGIAPSVSSWVSDRIGRRPLLIVGSALSALLIALLPHVVPGVSLFVV
jgi:MFS transporter, FSR family, fosmidomycin resistance protein